MSRVVRTGSSKSIAACATILMIVVGAVPMFASSLVLGAQTFYRLLATPLGQQNSPLPHPGVDVSLNPCPLPPKPNPNTSLDLTDPGSPVYFQPSAGQDYTQINWGMDFGTAGVKYSFGPNSPQPGDPGFNGNAFDFFAQPTNADGFLVGDKFRVSMQIGGINAGDLVSLNPCPLPPGFENMRSPTIGFQFGSTQKTDPTWTFQLFDVTPGGDVKYAFANDPVPEPATLVLAGSGLVAAHRWLRRRKRA